MMTSQEFGRCVHPREMPRFLLALLFALPISLLVSAAVLITPAGGIVLAVILLIAFLVWFGFEIAYASLLANWILVSEHNYPRLYELLLEMKEKIGVKENVDIIVHKQDVFSAAFSMLFARRAIYIGSELLAQGVTDDELRWLIGRFLGYFRAKRRMGPLRYVIALGEALIVFNFFINPYIRATIYTGDRVGLAAIDGDISSAVSAMNKLIVGRELGYSVNPAGVVRQYRRVKGSLFAFLARLPWPMPHIVARYVDLIGFAEREYPARAEEFANMNPSFQMSGGAWPLMRSTEKRGDGHSNALGLGLLAGAIVAPIVITFAWMTGLRGGGGFGDFLSGLMRPNSGYYQSTEATPEGYFGDAADPAAATTTEAAPAAEPYAAWQLSAEVGAAAEQARQARLSAEAAAEEARQTAQNGHSYGAESQYSGLGYFTATGEFAGDRLAGNFSEGYLHGAGVYEWGDNSNNSAASLRYEGHWVTGARSGYGIYSWRDGNQYLGQWSAGVRSGYGVMQFAGGNRYEGQWSSDQRHGFGVEWDANGNVAQTGIWNNGTLSEWR